jgi:hypothetical protein
MDGRVRHLARLAAAPSAVCAQAGRGRCLGLQLLLQWHWQPRTHAHLLTQHAVGREGVRERGVAVGGGPCRRVSLCLCDGAVMVQ